MDKKDRALLESLKLDSHKTVKELSVLLGIPPSTVHDRIQKMEKNGTIKRWTVIPDYAKVGKAVTVFILLKYVHGEGVSQKQVAEKIAKLPGVHEVHLITGTWDIIVKARVGSIDELSSLTVDGLGEMRGVGERVTINSLICAKEEI